MTSWESVSFADTDASGTYDRRYAWDHDDERYRWEMSLPRDVYDTHSRRHRVYDYGAYIADGTTQDLFDGFCETVESISAEQGFDAHEQVTFVARFVQSLPYTTDDVSTGYNNYPRYPIETLVDETGDCEDASLLLATLLFGLGYRVALIEFDSHLGVGVDLDGAPANVEIDGREYSYIEATGSGWNPGELPSTYEGQSLDLHHVGDSPVLYGSWQATVENGWFSCGGSVYNHGLDAAENVQCYVTLEAHGDRTVAAVSDRWDRLRPGEEVGWQASTRIDESALVRPEWVVAAGDRVHDRGEEAQKRI